MIIAYQLMLIVQLKFCNYTHNVSKSRNTESHLGIPWNDINWGDLRNGVTFSRISRVKIISNLENNKPEKLKIISNLENNKPEKFRKILAKFKKRERRKQPRNPNREPKRERLPWVPGFHKMRWIGVQFIPSEDMDPNTFTGFEESISSMRTWFEERTSSMGTRVPEEGRFSALEGEQSPR